MSSYRINMTDTAKVHINRLIEKENGVGLRISIKKTGCSGYSYAPSIVTEPLATDLKLTDVAHFPVYLDAAYIDLLEELSIDLVENNANGLKQIKLVFSNPKESGRCGCGESFHVSDSDGEVSSA